MIHWKTLLVIGWMLPIMCCALFVAITYAGDRIFGIWKMRVVDEVLLFLLTRSVSVGAGFIILSIIIWCFS